MIDSSSSSLDDSSMSEASPSTSGTPMVVVQCEVIPKTALRISITKAIGPQLPVHATRAVRIRRPPGSFVIEATIEFLRKKEEEREEMKRKTVVNLSSARKKCKSFGKTRHRQNTSEKESDERCWICATADPPDGEKGKVSWLQCENSECERWYHEYCDRDRPKDAFCLFGHKAP